MDRRMRTVETLEEALEAGVVSDVVVHEEVNIRLSEGRVDHHVWGHDTRGRARERGSGEIRLEGEVATDLVRNGVGDSETAETTIGDLVVAVGVAPGAETFIGVAGEDRSIEEVRGV